ncbi:MAG: hypothetical protein EBV16_03490 [Betaproteobacteria bacterium]|jgi:hypothetical protein|nr:hypothetical protein [Betaproteobacteria bacterium]NCV12874.1 hypothetical protein [Betaproteobacteria bacterium]
MPSCALKALAYVFVLGLIGLHLQACHVRTPEFHCKRSGASTENMELAMSPLEVRFESRRFAFVEERGNQRLYREATHGHVLLFDLSSMQLTEYESLQAYKTSTGDSSTAKDRGMQSGVQAALAFQIDAPVVKQWTCERYKML